MQLKYNKSILTQPFSIESPVAQKIPVTFEQNGVQWTDDYFWMRLSDEQKMAENPDDQTKAVIKYLEEENDYRERCMKPISNFEQTIYEEIKARIKQTDMSVPYFYNGYYYLTRYDEGNEYPVYSRKKGNLQAPDEVLLDLNELSTGFEYYSVATRAVSPDNEKLAFSEDNIGRRQYTIKIKNLATGELYPDIIKNTSGGITWGNDNKTLFYAVNDEALRSHKIYRHILGTDVTEDVCVFHEKDETFSTFIYKTKSKKYLVIASSSTLSNEYRILEADNPQGSFRLFENRKKNLEYDIEHLDDKWYIRTNKDGATDFKIMYCHESGTTIHHWKDFIPAKPTILIEGMEVFTDFMVISERVLGLTKIRIKPWNDTDEFYIEFQEPVHTVYTGINPECDSSVVRLEYTSLTTPNTTFDYDVVNKQLRLLKRQEVLGDFNPENYVSERYMVPSEDGQPVPLSIVYKKGFSKNGTHPALLYGYGSYGYSMDPYFSSARLSLLDRGFVFAIAHVRGGQEMGRDWYEKGKFFYKRNTFTDFIHCGLFLVKEQFADKDLLFAQGGSAGGLLMGAVVNMNPGMWKGIVAQVPFVDVINTMLDETIPLTTGEFDEWGNPKEENFFHYMRSYSPYDNVEKKEYPAMLVTTGFWDSQVQYWEPAKWVAKLRDYKTDSNPLFLYCNMDTGHGGASGRFKKIEETAMEYTFLLDLAGKVPDKEV